MDEATPIVAAIETKKEENVLTRSELANAVLNDFRHRIQGQPEGKPYANPRNKQQTKVWLGSYDIFEALFELNAYDRFNYFFKYDMIIIFQAKFAKHHLIFSTKTKAFYYLENGNYQRFKVFSGLVPDQPNQKKEHSLQEGLQ